MRRLVCVSPIHPLHQGHLIRRGGDVERGGLALVDAMFNSVHCVLLLHLHRVAQTHSTEEQLLAVLRWMRSGVTHTDTHSNSQTSRDFSEVRLTLASGPGDVSIMSMVSEPGITW